MSNISESKELLRRYAIARIPFIAINTIERGRTLELIKKVASEVAMTFYTHTLSKGVYDINTKKMVCENKTLYGALDFMSEQMRRLRQLTLVLTETPDISSENNDSRHLLDLVTLAEEQGGSVIVITNSPVWTQLQRHGMILSIDLPSESEMYEIISTILNDYRNEIPIEWTHEDVHEAAMMLTGVTRLEAQNIIVTLIANQKITKSDLDIVRFAKDRMFSDISGLERIEVDKSVADVGGLAGLRNWLDEKRALLSVEKREEMQSRGLHPPRGILLVGVPGCGKSLSAKAIALNWKLPLYRLDFATVQGSYVGQSEQQLKDALHTAERVSPCILWIDEIEKGLSGAISGGRDGGVSTRMVGQFLFWLQECKKHVFVVATANDVTLLPSELLRRGRFDEMFFIDLPTSKERGKIISIYAQKYLKTILSINLMEKLVQISDGFTSADLESTLRDIAYTVIANDNFVLNEESIVTIFNKVVPLSKTAPEKIEAVREWGSKRAIPASGRIIP
ncbi:MAG: AAA family ATPase [Chitinispirillia bacterium]|nr:AAA family ATPase [Chitinispirillia bacterium]